ncbi:MAG: delta-60 repeat domain-containing protein, partial [FCB group bacterium]
MKKHLLLLVITITVLILLQINFLLGQTPYLDPTFDISPGFDRPADLPNSSVYVVKVQSDGKILVGGGFNSFNGKPYHGVIRLNPNGGIDSSFKIGEGFNGPVYAIALQEDGKIVVGGEFSYYNYIRNSLLIRLNSDGSFDTTFHPFTAHWYGCVNNAIEIINGKIVFGYYFSEGFYGNIYRLNSDGSQDNSFKISELYNGNIYTIKEIQGHKLLIGGSFNALGKNKINYLNCINYDGTQNTSFNNRIGFNSTVYSINQSGDGKIIIGGMFDAAFVNSVKIPAGRIIRINSDGSLDMTFNPVPGFDKTVRNLLVQDNGKIIVAGSFDLYKNTTQHKISCLNSDGSIFSNDISFSGFDSSVYSMELQDDDKLLAGGAFTTYNNNLSEGLVRLYFEDSSQTFQAKIDNGRTFFTGDSIRISITTNMDFNPGNIFYVQLSDTDGYFTNNFIIDTIQAINNIYFYTKLPDNLPTSDMYKIRILSSSPLIVAGINKNISIVNPKIIGSKTVCTNSIFTYYTNLFGDIQYEWN